MEQPNESLVIYILNYPMMMINQQKLVFECEGILLSEFCIKPEKGRYITHSEREWFDFLKRTDSYPDSHGVYLPRNLSAHLKENSEFLPVNLLHEYFGHGLYCEHAIIGQRIVYLEQSLADIEKQIIGLEELPEGEHFQVDNTNSFFEQYKWQREELHKFFSQNIYDYEGFAIWLEHFLSKATSQESLFEKKMDKLIHPDYRRLFEQFYEFSENKGNFALIAQLGFPKFYDDNTIIDTLKRMYKGDFDSVELAIVYGSQNPYSDIDLLIVSDKIHPCYNHWIDIYARTPEEFNRDLSNFSIAVTDPLFSGRTILGDPDYQKQLQQKILNQPITQEAIQYNFNQSDEQGRVALIYSDGSKERQIALSYQRSFKRNAEELMNRNKILTLK